MEGVRKRESDEGEKVDCGWCDEGVGEKGRESLGSSWTYIANIK